MGDTAEAVRIARIAKWTATILGGVVLLLTATVFVLTSVIDPNRYRSKIEGIVANLAGRPFVIEGNLTLTWYPWLGIRTGPAHLDNPPVVPGPPMVEWQSISVAAKVWPLLKGDVVADRIRLQSPVIHLRRDAQGHGNWEGLGGRSSDADAAAGARGSAPAVDTRTASEPAASADTGTGSPGRAAPTSSPPPSSSARQLQIAGIEIRDGTVDYVDDVGGQHATLTNLELDTGEWRTGQSLRMYTRFLAHLSSLPPDGVWIQLDAPELTIRPEPLKVAAPKLTLKVANAQLDGDVTYEQAPEIHAHGSVVLRTESLRKLANDLALNQTLPHDPTTLGPLELATTWSYNDNALEAKPLTLKLDGVSFKGWLQRSAPPESMWGFELRGDRIDLGRYVQIDSTRKKPFELPVEALRVINANGSLIFDQVVLADTHMTNVRLAVQTPAPQAPGTHAPTTQTSAPPAPATQAAVTQAAATPKPAAQAPVPQSAATRPPDARLQAPRAPAARHPQGHQ